MTKAKKKVAVQQDKKSAKRRSLKDIIKQSLQPPPQAITPPERVSKKDATKKK